MGLFFPQDEIRPGVRPTGFARYRQVLERDWKNLILVGFITLAKIGLLGGGAANVDTATGLMILVACLPIAVVGLVSALHQGKTAASGIGIVAKKPDQFGKAMLFPAMVETYAILALLISILTVSSIQV